MERTNEILEKIGLKWEKEVEIEKRWIKSMKAYKNEKLKNGDTTRLDQYKRVILKDVFGKYELALRVNDKNIFKKIIIEKGIKKGFTLEWMLEELRITYISYGRLGDFKVRVKISEEKIDELFDDEKRIGEIGEELIEGYSLKKVFNAKEAEYELGYKYQEEFMQMEKCIEESKLTKYLEQEVFEALEKDIEEKSKEEMEKYIEKNFYAI